MINLQKYLFLMEYIKTIIKMNINPIKQLKVLLIKRPIVKHSEQRINKIFLINFSESKYNPIDNPRHIIIYVAKNIGL